MSIQGALVFTLTQLWNRVGKSGFSVVAKIRPLFIILSIWGVYILSNIFVVCLSILALKTQDQLDQWFLKCLWTRSINITWKVIS